MTRFPELTADDIEVRVASVNSAVVELLLYKDARVDARILDETVGPDNWQCDYYECKGTLFCKVGVKVERPPRADGMQYEWIWKADAGAPSNVESQKGEASDAFKRACFKWGIGRELYTAPRITVWWNQDDQRLCNVKQNDKGRWVCYDDFKVSQVIIQDGEVKALSILNQTTGKYVYRWDGREK